MDELIIEAGRTEKHYWRDLWRYRELFYFLAWRDILVRYKQTTIGVLWAFIRPLMTIVVLAGIFGGIAKLPSNGVPYALFVAAGTLPWALFSNSFMEAGNSLVGNSGLISKVYFPRLIIPAGAVVVSLVDFLVSFVILGALIVFYQYWPDWRILTLPLFIVVAAMAAMGAGLWIAALTVKYRDFRFIVPFIVQFGLYVSPVGFGSANVPESLRLYYSLNPLVGVIDGFRWALFRGQVPLDMGSFFVSILFVIILLASGIWFFRKTEKTFADVI